MASAGARPSCSSVGAALVLLAGGLAGSFVVVDGCASVITVRNSTRFLFEWYEHRYSCGDPGSGPGTQGWGGLALPACPNGWSRLAAYNVSQGGGGTEMTSGRTPPPPGRETSTSWGTCTIEVVCGLGCAGVQSTRLAGAATAETAQDGAFINPFMSEASFELCVLLTTIHTGLLMLVVIGRVCILDRDACGAATAYLELDNNDDDDDERRSPAHRGPAPHRGFSNEHFTNAPGHAHG